MLINIPELSVGAADATFEHMTEILTVIKRQLIAEGDAAAVKEAERINLQINFIALMRQRMQPSFSKAAEQAFSTLDNSLRTTETVQ